MITYRNTNASQPVALHPRAVYRVQVQRRTVDGPLYLTGIRSWRNVVADVIDGSAGAAAFPLGGNLSNVMEQDTVATLDYRAATNPGGATVADIVRQVEGAGPVVVSSVERLPPVPGFSDGGPDVLTGARDASQDEARERAAAESFGAKLTAAVQGVGRVTMITAAAVIAVAAVIFIPRGK